MQRALVGRARLGLVLSICIASVAVLLAGCGGKHSIDPPPLPPWMSVEVKTPVPPAPPPPSVWQPLADVSVANFMACGCGGQQAQVKVKLILKNVGDGPLNISIQNIRLLTDNFNRAQWDPDHPIPSEPSNVTVGDQSFTAVPANTNRDFRWVTVDGKKVATWASHWYGDTLQPGQAYQINDKGQGHVVFNVPLVGGDKVNISGIGLVSNDGNALLGWSPVKDWPKDQTDPNNF